MLGSRPMYSIRMRTSCTGHAREVVCDAPEDDWQRNYCGYNLARWLHLDAPPVGGHDATSHLTRRVTCAPPFGRFSADARGDFPVPVPVAHVPHHTADTLRRVVVRW